MHPLRWRITHSLVVLVLGLPLSAARAGLVRDAAFLFGTDVRGSRNFLGDGVDLLASQTFVGNPLNFGLADVTLQGPISLAVSTSRRGLSQFDVRLSTAVDRNAAAVPLTYRINSGLGGQSTEVTGSLFLDMGLSFDALGFYDMELVYSSRQDVSRTGPLGEDNQQFDADLGPINVSGNIFADILAILTDPFFDAGGAANPFVSISGPNSLSAFLADAADRNVQRLASGDNVPAQDRAKVISLATAGVASSGKGSAADAYTLGTARQASKSILIVPEPTVLVLMLLGIPAIMAPRLRRIRR